MADFISDRTGTCISRCRTCHAHDSEYAIARRSGSHRYSEVRTKCSWNYLDRKSRKRLIMLNTAIEFRRFADYLHGLRSLQSMWLLKPLATIIALWPISSGQAWLRFCFCSVTGSGPYT